MSLTPETKLVCPPEVLSRMLDGEAVLLHLGTGTYFGMNEVATHAWAEITRGTTFGALVDSTVKTFEVERDVAVGDLEKLVGALVERQLVTLDG